MVIRECLDVFGGNSGLTESVIYSNPPKSKDRSIIVYSGSTIDNTLLGNIDRDTVVNGKTMIDL